MLDNYPSPTFGRSTTWKYRLATLLLPLLLLASNSAAQSRSVEPLPAKDKNEQPALEQGAGTNAPELTRGVKQELSQAPSSPDAPARKEEPLNEETGPVPLQPFVEPEPSETPQH